MSEKEPLIGYCLKCKEKREIKEAAAEWASNGSPATRGKCTVCDGNVYLRGRTAAHDLLPKPEVQPKVKGGKKKSSSKRKSSKKKGAKKSSQRRSGKLVIVESPAKAKTIGKYLGSGYTVKSSVGHVRDLLKSRLSVDVENQYQPEYRVPNEKRAVVKDLKAAAAKAKEIYLAMDPDREGEAIAWHVLESAEMELERTQRVVFHEITKGAILEAFKTPRDIDMDRVDAQQARRILDRLVGYQLSPLLWRKIRGRLSAGRVQSVAVRLIVERQREIDKFEKEEYWHIKADVRQKDKGKEAVFSSKLHRYKGKEVVLKSEADVLPHLDSLEKAFWQVSRVKLGSRKRRPAPPFTTSTIQQEASRKLNFGANKTMRIAQQLYEGVELGNKETVGLITYMRTDSVSVSAVAQTEARGYIEDKFGTEYRPSKARQYKTKSKSAQEAHEAIRPTAVANVPKGIKGYLSRDQYRLYTLIWQRFVASQMSDALYDTVSADLMAGDEKIDLLKRDYLFRASGSSLRFPGFLALYEEGNDDKSNDDDESVVPADLKAKQLIALERLDPNQHFTQPPPLYSEATLVKALEENGIGRPSTYASIISTIQNRGYVIQEKKRLTPTETGELVTDLLVEYFPDLLSVDFTARMENDLDKIAEGSAWVPVLDQFYQGFAKRLKIADDAIEKVALKAEVEEVGRACPTCSSPLVYRHGRFGRFIGCSTFPTCRFTEQILQKVGVSCEKCKTGDLVQKRSKKGRTFYSCSNYPDCDWTNWNKPLVDRCVSCKGMLVQTNRRMTECTVCGDKRPLEQKLETSEVAS